METISREDIVSIIKNLDLDGIPDDFVDNISLREQGLDSLDMMTFYFALEEKLGISLSDDTLTNEDWKTIDGIVVNINKFLKER